MIDYIKENYLWLSAVVVPIIVAIIGGIVALVKKSGRSQKTGDINGNNNIINNGDIK
jgi:ABC-type Na+ efflux pump permease subunit